MIDQYFLVLTTIDLFVLTFMCILTKLSETLNSKQKRGFFLAFALIGVISILEVITILVDGAPVHLRCLNILSNYLGFGLSPAVAACLVYALDKKTVISRKFKAAVGCEVVYLLLLTALLPSGMVFSVSEDNVYARGPYFAFYIVMYLAALAYLAVSTIVTAWEFQNRSRVLLYPLIVFLAAETIIQIALPQLHVTWLCVTLLSVLYFIYCSEMWNQLDALTGLLNQNSYLNRTAEMRRSGEVLVVFTSDHGTSPSFDTGHEESDRFNTRQFEVIVNGFLNVRYGMGDWVLEYEDKCVYLNHNLIYERGLDLAEVQNEVAIFAMQFRGVSHALSATAMRTSYFGSGYARKMQNSFYPRRSGDVILNLMPGWIEEQERCWSSSGSMYGYDTQVPLVFYGVGVGPQRIKRRMDMTAVAPTVARMLEITEPAASEGEVLPEIIDL